jgi:hypothetical protein
MKLLNFFFVFVFINTSIFAQSTFEWQKNPDAINKAYSFDPFDKTVELKTKSFVQIYDSIVHWHWDTISNTWDLIPYSKTINMNYDSNNNLINESWFSWNGINWENHFQYTCTYDVNNIMTSSIWQVWNDTVWENISLNTFTYDVNNNLINSLYQIWDSTIWTNNFQITYTYDINNNLTSRFWQTWNSTTWGNSSLDTTYIYDANNNLIGYLRQNWDSTSWINDHLITCTYDVNNNMTNFLDQIWTGTIWNNYSLSSYIYDVNNNMTSCIIQDWDSTAWTNSRQYINTYDSNNFKKSQVLKQWNYSDTCFDNSDSAYYYFHTVVGISEFLEQPTDFILFPNPCTDLLTVIVQNNSIFEILNINGKTIKSVYCTSESTIVDLTDLSSGVYIVRIKTDKEVITKKIIKE